MKLAQLEERASILVVDDVPKNLDLMKAILTVADYEVVTASDGEEALRQVKDAPPDLILLDVMMPGLNGYKACAQLKGNEKTRLIPIILLAPPGEDRMRGIEAGSDDFLYRPINRVELLTRVRSLVQQKSINAENTLIALARAVKAKDTHTEGHIERVAIYASSLGKEVGLSQRTQRLLHKGGLLHDVGKIGIRESVLTKQGPLSDEEFNHLKIHPIVGERICQPLGLDRLVLDVIRHHHERYDGIGYPDGLASKDIPLAARIMAVVDAYDALTADRPQHRKLLQEEALEVLWQEAGRQFDPALALTFIGMVERELIGQP